MPPKLLAVVKPMRKLLVAGVASIALAAPAIPVAGGLFSATGMVIAILGDELFLGEAEGHFSGAGTLAIRSQKEPGLTCSGQFTSSAEQGGKGSLRCTDGTSSTFQFKRLTIWRGHGSGSFDRSAMNFTYGLTVEEAQPYLTLPKGKKLVHKGKELELVDL